MDNSEMEALKRKLREEENKKEKKKIIILLLLLLLLIILIILWTHFIKKPTVTLGEKDINENYIETPTPIASPTLIPTPTIIENNIIHEITKPITIINNNTTIIQQIVTQTPTPSPEVSPSPEPVPSPVPTQEPVEINKEFIVSSKSKQWTETLSIFNNEKYGRNTNNISRNRKYILL